MDIVENTLDASLGEFLARPLFCFLAQSSESGPRVSPLWFHWDGEQVWLIAMEDGRSYPDRLRQFPESALAVVDFDPKSGRVEHVGMRGTATLEPFDADRADRLLTKYLGPDRGAWDERFRGLDGDGYGLVRFDPATVVARAQSYAGSLQQ
ncbi:pyridoxamine 5'-phosphate oxidase family protein [Halomicroarcula sp. S1AR25-4]|uniref:pyridoxamine 5'-phosphate oxidase family protein n=1 Tax=Haloarcula sp. S1AR25-4 TaxID=2950538 RepID=UPI0028762ADB|nr:pyridoxamine 5'-phosphate oxidase family protein [Halomicroarcula sp. S1AR25-4]MDS0278977.1 pyridoxamine 5'-phosphate oxidase family protein [Halomicroarcula sp. S1AR25-4]